MHERYLVGIGNGDKVPKVELQRAGEEALSLGM